MTDVLKTDLKVTAGMAEAADVGHLEDGIAAALAGPVNAQAGGWLPIESAPRDGRLFLVWVDSRQCGEDDEGRLMEVDVSECDFAVWQGSEHDGYVSAMASPRATLERVSHWMPLPAGPVEG